MEGNFIRYVMDILPRAKGGKARGTKSKKGKIDCTAT